MTVVGRGQQPTYIPNAKRSCLVHIRTLGSMYSPYLEPFGKGPNRAGDKYVVLQMQ